MTIRKNADGEKTLNIIQSVMMSISFIERLKMVMVVRLNSATKNKSTYQKICALCKLDTYIIAYLDIKRRYYGKFTKNIFSEKSDFSC